MIRVNANTSLPVAAQPANMPQGPSLLQSLAERVCQALTSIWVWIKALFTSTPPSQIVSPASPPQIPSPQELLYEWGPISLSPQAKRVVVGEPKVIPLDFANLKPYPVDADSADFFPPTKEENASIYKVSACGRPEIDVLLDGDYLYVHMDHSKRLLAPGKKALGCKQSRFFWLKLLSLRGKSVIDEPNVTASLDNPGILTVRIPYLSS